jgi:hypothetical protein
MKLLVNLHIAMVLILYNIQEPRRLDDEVNRLASVREISVQVLATAVDLGQWSA